MGKLVVRHGPDLVGLPAPKALDPVNGLESAFMKSQHCRVTGLATIVLDMRLIFWDSVFKDWFFHEDPNSFAGNPGVNNGRFVYHYEIFGIETYYALLGTGVGAGAATYVLTPSRLY